MIPLPPRLYLYAGVAILTTLMVANTYRLSAAVDREHARLVECQAKTRELEQTIASLRHQIDEQNAAVDAWKSSAQEAQERAAKALEKVAATEASRRVVVERLEAFQRTAGESECEATRRLLQEYRR